MRALVALGAIAVASSLVGIACAARRPETAASHASNGTSCRLTITNELSVEIEIVESVRSSRVVVGTVRPKGRTVITPLEGARYYARESRAENFVGWEGNDTPYVRFRRECA